MNLCTKLALTYRKCLGPGMATRVPRKIVSRLALHARALCIMCSLTFSCLRLHCATVAPCPTKPELIIFSECMLRPERDKHRLCVHKCLGSRRPMLRPERDKNRLGFHKCLGSRRPMLCPERHKIRVGFHKCLGAQEAHVVSRTR